jgi:carnitine-CoA ligase
MTTTIPAQAPNVHARSVGAVLDDAVRRAPDKFALREDGRDLSYREIREFAYRIAGGLSAVGLTEQEPVLVMLDNHIDYVLLWLGIGVSPFIEVPINTAYKGDMLSYVIENSQARVAVIDSRFCEVFFAALAQSGNAAVTTVVVRGDRTGTVPDQIRCIGFEQLHGTADPTLPKQQPWDRAAIMYTSGTTGRSKGVTIPQGHAYASAEAYPATTADDVMLVLLPLFHVAGKLASVYNTLIRGGTAVIAPAFSATGFWQQVRRYQATTTILVGGMAEFLWKQPPSDSDRGHSLRLLGIVPAYARIDEFRERFGVQVQSVYGSTESGSVLVGDIEEADAKACGRPRPDIEARLVDEHDIEVPAGTAGELIVRSSIPWSMMSDYYNMPEATVSAWRNSWFHTGDTMYRAADGQFCFVDRRKDAIRKRGENVSSFEVEAQLILRDEIVAAAVVGVPCEHEDEDIKAVIVLDAGATLDPMDLVVDLAARMPYFMVPRYVEIIDALPMTATQRVQKAELRAAGVTATTWDAVAAGVRVTRHGVELPSKHG